MKQLFTLLAFVITITTFAQAPQGHYKRKTLINAGNSVQTD